MTIHTALVTGSSGFIGHHLVSRLVRQGVEVRCLVRPTSDLRHLAGLPVRFIEGEITQGDALRHAAEGCEVVFHLAGITRALDRADMYRVNAEGAHSVAQAAAACETPPTLVVVSSLAAAGPTDDPQRPRCEEDPVCPVSTYGRSKRLGECLAARLGGEVPLSIVRPPIVLGEADRASLDLFVQMGRTGLCLIPGWAPATYSVVHADDLATLLIAVAERGQRLPPWDDRRDARGFAETSEPVAPEGCYFARSETDLRLDQLGDLIAAAMGAPPPRKLRAGPIIVWTAASAMEAIGQLRRRPANFGIDKAREARAGHWVCDGTKATRQLGFHTERPLSERLEQTVAWYREHSWL